MARYSKALLLMLLFLLGACQEGGEAGDLFGQWRLSDSDTKYVSFAGTIVMFRSLGEGEVYGNFQHQGDSLFIQCHSIAGERRDTVMIEQSFGLKPFSDIRLKVTALDSEHLTLEKGGQTWKWRIY